MAIFFKWSMWANLEIKFRVNELSFHVWPLVMSFNVLPNPG